MKTKKEQRHEMKETKREGTEGRDAKKRELQHSSIFDFQQDQRTNNHQTRNTASSAPATLIKVSEPILLFQRRCRPISAQMARARTGTLRQLSA